jgi:hypothetical protein
MRCALLILLVSIPACETPSLVDPCDSATTASRGLGGADTATWPHEPPGFTILTDGIPGVSGSGWKCEADGDALSLDGQQLVFTYRPGFHSGYAPGVAYLDLTAPAPEVYFGFWWKPSRPWQSHSSGVNKVALLFPSTSAGGTVYIMMFHDGERYTMQVETTFDADTRRLEPNLTATPVSLGAWHRVEWYVKYSSNPSSRDGVVRWWLDGVPQGEYSDLQMPPDAGFTQYTIRPVWGGGVGDTKGQADSFSYGRARASRR